MPRKARVRSKSGIYHIIWRGANRQEIFHDEEDSLRYLEIIRKYKMKFGLAVYAWCLMNNHVHLLVREGKEDISATMKRIGVSYVQYYNWKYRTTGHLFQDRFKSENVEDNKYLLTVVRYIHQNPVKAKMVQQVDEWKWSSCRGYYGKDSSAQKMLDCGIVLKVFSDDITIATEKFKEFNERKNEDSCLEGYPRKRRLIDDEARVEIKKVLGSVEIARVKSLPATERREVIRKVKGIEGVSVRQVARILGVSVTFFY